MTRGGRAMERRRADEEGTAVGGNSGRVWSAATRPRRHHSSTAHAADASGSFAGERAATDHNITARAPKGRNKKKGERDAKGVLAGCPTAGGVAQWLRIVARRSECMLVACGGGPSSRFVRSNRRYYCCHCRCPQSPHHIALALSHPSIDSFPAHPHSSATDLATRIPPSAVDNPWLTPLIQRRRLCPWQQKRCQ